MVNMDDALAERLRQARTAGEVSLQAVSQPAGISAAYLHKLEAGRVHSPSPRVLRRLAEVLNVPYRDLMELAGYLDPGLDIPAGPRPRTEKATKELVKLATLAPTNERIVALLEDLRVDVAQLKKQHDEMTKRLERLRDRQPADGRSERGGR